MRTVPRFAIVFALSVALLAPQAIGLRSAQAEDQKPFSLVRQRVMAALQSAVAPIDGIELYGIPVSAERRFSYEVEKGRLHLFIRFTAGGKSGWTEMNLGPLKAGDSLEARAARVRWFRELLGKTPAEAVAYLAAHQNDDDWGSLEAAEMAVLDLGGRLIGKPAAEILGLSATNPVPGLFCILTDDPQQVRAAAKLSLEQNLRTHLKVKLYGKRDVDTAVVAAAREVMGPAAYLGGDVNMGYRRKASDQPVDDVVAALTALREAGLNACEDPATMSNAQWAEVQRRVGSLALIPDEPMRPAWKSKRTLDPATGQIFNMHPNCMGSLIETVELGRAIQQQGKKVMVGDASLVGPACVAWEQIAIGLGADWVEAIEKPQENNVFQQCLRTNPVQRTAEGRFGLGEPLPGFGVELDTERLKALSSGVISLGTDRVEPKTR